MKRLLDCLMTGLAEPLREECDKNEMYGELTEEINELLESYPRVKGVIEYNRPSELTKEDSEAIFKWMELEGTKLGIELEVAYILGMRDGVAFTELLDLKKD